MDVTVCAIACISTAYVGQDEEKTLLWAEKAEKYLSIAQGSGHVFNRNAF